jgi:Tol biopolymer transport system component
MAARLIRWLTLFTLVPCALLAFGAWALGRAFPAAVVAFSAENGLHYAIYAVDVERNLTLALTPTALSEPPHFSFASGGQLVFSSIYNGTQGIFIVDTNGLRLLRDDNRARAPHWSPDGSQIAFVSGTRGSWGVHLMNADGGDERLLFAPENGVFDSLRWSPDGTRLLLFVLRNDLFDAYGGFVWDTFIIDIAARTGFFLIQSIYRSAVWSPDGTSIAYVLGGQRRYAIYVVNADGSSPRSLSGASFSNIAPLWSPDGTHIAFTSDRDGNAEVYVMDGDGSSPRNLTNSSAAEGILSWSPQGEQLLFSFVRGAGSGAAEYNDYYVLDVQGGGARNLTESLGTVYWVSWSLDSRYIAFLSPDSGSAELYFASVETGEARRLTWALNPATVYPVWMP